MATLTAMRQALETRLETITGLSAYAFPPGTIAPDAAVVTTGQGPFLTYDTSYGGASHDVTLLVTVFVQWGDDQSAIEALDKYIAASGTYSIAAVIAADPTLGGVVSSARVTDARNYGAVTYGEIRYLGCDFPVEILA